ncbi:MAG: ssuA [Amycolatopsis sp.]|jgi:ABC-type nitrate/sulfonate/bicarbonate transport system substrate-binding protein|uniref:ABC transporter substrate-binding protein n=1 Tax=Amycolatopsis sp. TaxID=37632 RepID=UPI00261F6265|nr:ABC transporter substrate-binding protein [Amycolatopsis sp.]MCU1679674.1 ssuA [Amycolatopsis sp.]
MATRSRRLLLPLVAVLLLAGGCGLFSGDKSAPPPLERTTLRVGVGNAIDTAPLRLAVADGRFNRAGLKIDLVEEGSGDGLAKLASGDLDIAFANDVSMFRAAAGGTALQLQGEAYTAGSGTMGLVTLANSPYTDPGAKKAPTIAVDMLDDLSTLAARSVLGTAGVDPTKITFYQCPYDQMTKALNDGEADAAWMVEPYITKAEKELGAQVLADGARGATQNFPVSAYASGRVFAQANPRTLALFRQVLGDAQEYAADPAVVRSALPRFSSIDATSASLIALGTYPTSLNAIRLQRVADLMHNAGALADRLDVQSLLPRG